VKIVLDTNVFVAALLTPHGDSARLLDLVLRGELLACFDDRVMGEYIEVLARSEFGFPPQNVESLLAHIATSGHKVTATALPSKLPDPDDLMFLEVALASQAEALITGNIRHFPATHRYGVHVIPPAEFLAWWRNRREA
jgi:putative PIN family toxin of toxin-antitoxin system